VTGFATLTATAQNRAAIGDICDNCRVEAKAQSKSSDPLL